ncbi:hypothetical protein RUM44_003230 [Polyplax serrata]|uniref:Amino acid transporter transmembrane domain-containing protein n=1 Tax=Polyplax serrata TaxID=468196 RepID=A0ABR1AYJ9_POLSC
MAGNTGHVMNLANSIIGVGLLAMPFCFKQCGITIAIAMLIFSSVISRLACHFLVKSSALCRRRNFEFLAFYTFGPPGKLLVDLGIIGFMMGTCVAFFVVMGDLGPAIISKILNINNNSTLRTGVLLALGVLVVLPLGLLRNIESLVSVSTATIGFYFLFTIKIFLESSHQLLAGDWWYHVNFWKPEGVLQCIPIFAMSLCCQTQIFEIYESLSTPTVDKINSIVHSAINLCTVVYASVGFLGYVAYCKGTFSGNILLSFTPSFSSELFKLGFVMSIAVSFPLVIFPCRASLYSLIFKKIQIHHETIQTSSHIPDARFKLLTIAIVMVSLTTGLLIPSIELVLGFVGSTIGVGICVIFPSLSYLNLNGKNANDKMVAKATVVAGLIIMVMGTFGNLYAAIENKTTEAYSEKFVNPKDLSELKIRSGRGSSEKYVKKDISGKEFDDSAPLGNSYDTAKREGLSIQGVVSLKELQDNQRKEPPVPVAPIIDPKLSRKISNLNTDEKKKWDTKGRKIVDVLPVKLNGNISRDAIEKENQEILEVEKQLKAYKNDKEIEFLNALKAHQDEQKKLLMEQKRILNEIKNREIKNEKKLNEILKEKSEASVDGSKTPVKSSRSSKLFMPEENIRKKIDLDEKNVLSSARGRKEIDENEREAGPKNPDPVPQRLASSLDISSRELENVVDEKKHTSKGSYVSRLSPLALPNSRKEGETADIVGETSVGINETFHMVERVKEQLKEKNATREKRAAMDEHEEAGEQKCLKHGDTTSKEAGTEMRKIISLGLPAVDSKLSNLKNSKLEFQHQHEWRKKQ